MKSHKRDRTDDQIQADEPPPLDRGFGMLQRLARRRTTSITEMRAGVRQRAKKKHSVKRA
jgi:hypothetical protein